MHSHGFWSRIDSNLSVLMSTTYFSCVEDLSNIISIGCGPYNSRGKYIIKFICFYPTSGVWINHPILYNKYLGFVLRKRGLSPKVCIQGLNPRNFAIEYMYIYSIALTLDLSYFLTVLTGVGKLLFWLPNGARVTESLYFH